MDGDLQDPRGEKGGEGGVDDDYFLLFLKQARKTKTEKCSSRISL